MKILKGFQCQVKTENCKWGYLSSIFMHSIKWNIAEGKEERQTKSYSLSTLNK